MKVGRWLTVALIVSWTLNVMLGVTLYLHFIRAMEQAPPDRFGQPPHPAPHFLKQQWGERIRERSAPYHFQQRQLIIALSQAFLSDSLDRERVNQLADSLIAVKCNLHREFIAELMEIHPHLTPLQREELFARALRRGMGMGPHFRNRTVPPPPDPFTPPQ